MSVDRSGDDCTTLVWWHKPWCPLMAWVLGGWEQKGGDLWWQTFRSGDIVS